MTTLGALAIGFRASKAAAKTRTKTRSELRIRVWLSKLLGALGTVLGLACFVVAAWMVAIPLGLLVAGAALLVLEWRLAE